MSLGPAIKPKPPAPKPEWTRAERRGFWRHRDPPHRLRYDPDAWEQAAATLEDNARRVELEPDYPVYPPLPDDSGFIPPLIDRE